MVTPNMFLSTVQKHFTAGSSNLESIKKFLLLRLSGVTIATSLLRSTQDYLKLLFHMFPVITKFSKFSKVNSGLISKTSTQKYL